MLAKHPLDNIENMNKKINNIINSIEKFDNDHFKNLMKEVVPLHEENGSNLISFNKKNIE